MDIEECPRIRVYIRLHTRKHETPHYRSWKDGLLLSEFLYRLPVKSTDTMTDFKSISNNFQILSNTLTGTRLNKNIEIIINFIKYNKFY